MYICSECKKSFGRAGNLKTHMISHSKDGAYNCVQSHKSFGQARHLKDHMLKHSGEKAHTCSDVRSHLVEQEL